MRGRWAATGTLAAALALAGPGMAALHAGEAPSEPGRPSGSSSPGSRAPETPPGRESEDPGGNGGPDGSGQDGGPPVDEPADQTPGTGTSPDAGVANQPPEPPPPPQPDLSGTRVLRSRLGPPRAATADDGDAVSLRDLHVVVAENDAAGIDGGWWVTVTTSDGAVTVDVPSARATGEVGVAQVPASASLRRGSLLSVKGQRSNQRYQGLYEAAGTLRLRADAAIERPVITVLLVQ